MGGKHFAIHVSLHRDVDDNLCLNESDKQTRERENQNDKEITEIYRNVDVLAIFF